MSGLDSGTGKLAVGVGVGVVTLIAVKLWLDSKKKAGPPVPSIKSSFYFECICNKYDLLFVHTTLLYMACRLPWWTPVPSIRCRWWRRSQSPTTPGCTGSVGNTAQCGALFTVYCSL